MINADKTPKVMYRGTTEPPPCPPYQLQDIEKYQSTGKSSQKTVSSISPVMTGTIHTVADLFAAVKRMDADFQPNSASKVVNANKSPKVMYQGTTEPSLCPRVVAPRWTIQRLCIAFMLYIKQMVKFTS